MQKLYRYLLERAGILYFGEDEMKSRNKWIQALAWLLCIALFCGLISIAWSYRKMNKARSEEIKQRAEKIEEEDNQKTDAQAAIYEDFYSQLELRRFVCWGDSAMVGQTEASLPAALQTVVDENLFTPLENAFSRVLENDKYSLPSVRVNNMGVVNEGMRQILVRAGVNSMEVGDWMQIPADTEPVALRLLDDEAKESKTPDDELRFAKQTDVSFGKVWISDVEGTLVETDDWFDAEHPRYAFVRDEEGRAMSVGRGTEVEIESGFDYIGDVPVFFFENEGERPVDEVVSDMEELVNRYANTEEDESSDDVSADEASAAAAAAAAGSTGAETAPEVESGPVYEIPFVVICTTEQGSELDSALAEAFGSRYIRNQAATAEMTEKSYKELAQQVYDALNEQGCFDEIRGKITSVVEEAEGM